MSAEYWGGYSWIAQHPSPEPPQTTDYTIGELVVYVGDHFGLHPEYVGKSARVAWATEGAQRIVFNHDGFHAYTLSRQIKRPAVVDEPVPGVTEGREP